MSDANAEKVTPSSKPRTARGHRFTVFIASWFPALIAAGIAWYFLSAISRNKVELATLDGSLKTAREELRKAQQERAAADAERTRLAVEIAEKQASLQELQDAITSTPVPDGGERAWIGEVKAIANGAATSWKKGKAAEKGGDIEGAVREYTGAITADPTYVRAYLSLGRLYENKPEATRADLTRAAEWYRRGAERNRLNPDAWENLAFVDIRRGDWPELIQACIKLAQLRPNSEALPRVKDALQRRDSELTCSDKSIGFAQYLAGLDAENRGALQEAIELYSAACEGHERKACYMLEKAKAKARPGR